MPHPAVSPSGQPRPLALALGGLVLASLLTGCSACDRIMGLWSGNGPAIQVIVRNTFGQYVPGATVTLGTQSGVTGEGGFVRFEGMSTGTYMLRVTAPGFTPYEYGMALALGFADYDVTLRGPNQVQGRLVNAETGAAAAGVPVIARRGAEIEFMARSDSSGTYRLVDAPDGTYSFCVAYEVYIPRCLSDVPVSGGTVVVPPIALIPMAAPGSIRIAVTWRATPRDLDAHLSGPNEAGGRFHVFFRNRSTSGVSLDHDETSGSGLETITLPASRDGTYRYSVLNFSDQSPTGAQGIAASPARVEVYNGARHIRTYRPPAAGSGNTWRVFEMTLSGGYPTFNDHGDATLGYVNAVDSHDAAAALGGPGAF